MIMLTDSVIRIGQGTAIAICRGFSYNCRPLKTDPKHQPGIRI
jgi:hypothetical protein